jgi:broad specificity phosphatase PhoE
VSTARMVRLRLVCAGATRSTRRSAFPADDESLEAKALAAATAMAPAVGACDRAFAGPSRRARETALALGLDAQPVAGLGDIAAGRWTGLTVAEVASREPDAFLAWRTDVNAAPHGGEAIAGVFARVRALLAGLDDGRTVAVTHAAVIRVAIVLALDAPRSAFWSIDVEPLAVLDLVRRDEGWRLRRLSPPGRTAP